MTTEKVKLYYAEHKEQMVYDICNSVEDKVKKGPAVKSNLIRKTLY
jgi:hypothetical protein